ncbi:MAG: hydrolase [Anaerolineae bacterium SG8_19]|jgi:putative selenium metabolism protein SsnA|nr:MAG: hydrolase [Anaerolineae bacterium SG8_19]
MDELLITNGQLVTWGEDNEIIDGGALLLRNGRIAAIGDSQILPLEHPEVETIDAGGQLVMPGNICAHTHFYGAFARGMAIPGPPMKDFPEILKRLWWRLDRALTTEDVEYSALVCLVDAIKHGTTTLIDHHASPNVIAGSLDVIAGAVEKAGLRAGLCYEVTDRNGPDGAQAGIDENVRYLKALKADNSGLLSGTFGLHASLSLSDETLASCVDAASELDTGFHIHVAEHEADEYDSLYKYDKRAVNRLALAGILGPKSIVAHAVHVDPAEKNMLNDTGTWVTHQPRSNMNNAVGAADIEGMLRLGIPVCLGNDGFSNNMWAEWKTAYLLHKVVHRDPRRANGMDIAQMAIYNNAALTGIFWPELPIGRLEVGAAADIILVDYHPTTPLTAGNLPWHIIFGFEIDTVTTTIVAGRVLMRDRQLLTLDEAEITAKSRELARGVWQRFEELSVG